jgi:ABC-type Na+ efflux pump permease subunit
MRFGGLRLFRLQYPFVLLLFLFSILVPCSQLFAEETIEEKQAKIAESNISFLQDQTRI